MFSRLTALLLPLVLLASQVMASPVMPVPVLKARSPAPLEVIPAYSRSEIPDVGRRQIPAEQAVKSDNGNIVPYDKRQQIGGAIPVEEAVKSENGNIVPTSARSPRNRLLNPTTETSCPMTDEMSYVARFPPKKPLNQRNGNIVPYDNIPQKRQIPAEEAVKSENGNIKRQIPAEQAVKSDNGNIVPYDKRDVVLRQIPAEQAVKSDNGNIVPYDKRDVVRRQIPAEEAVKSENGNIVPY
ncbi:hypothetical protein BDZ89DRAFT_1034183 [Hymenopellis radicata]|nr:hypothetical protein BDZ89DRAFT_1034183 [Hymenopellis radicata]